MGARGSRAWALLAGAGARGREWRDSTQLFREYFGARELTFLSDVDRAGALDSVAIDHDGVYVSRISTAISRCRAKS